MARAIIDIEPDAQVAVDLGAKLVTVSGAVGPADRIALAVTAAGYPAEQVRATA